MLCAFVVITFSINQSLCTFLPDCSWCERVMLPKLISFLCWVYFWIWGLFLVYMDDT